MKIRNLDSKSGRSDTQWIQDNINLLSGELSSNESGILNIGEISLNFSTNAISITEKNITINIENSTISYSGPQIFNFINCPGGGIIGNGTIVGPLTINVNPVTSYGIRAIGCSKMRFSGFTIKEGNSGIELSNTSLSEVESVTFHEMTGTGVKCTGADSWGNNLQDVAGRNLAGFLIYGNNAANRNRVSNPRKWIDHDYLVNHNYLETGKFFSRSGIIESAPSKKNGVNILKNFIGEEGVGVTFDCSHWQVEGGDISGVGDNGISITGSFCLVQSVYVHDNMHDGIHFYGNQNTAINCFAENNGKYSDDIVPVAVNGYGFSARPNAGGSAVDNSFMGCVSLDNMKGDFHAGDAAAYTPWVAEVATGSKAYCYADLSYTTPATPPVIEPWTLVWDCDLDTPPTDFGPMSLTAAGITIDEFGNPSSKTWLDGSVAGGEPVTWKWRSSCRAGQGPWAHNTRFSDCWGNHPTREFHQDSVIPETSKRTNVFSPEMTSPNWSLGSDSVVFNSVGTGTILYTTVGQTATPDLSMRVQRLDAAGVPKNIEKGTILQKFVGSGWSRSPDEISGSYKQVGRLYSVVTALDNLGEPRVSWRINHQPAHHMRDKILSSLTWSGGTVSGTTVAEHGQTPGSVLRLPITGADPDAYDGTYDITFSGTHGISYALPSDTSIAPSTKGTLRGNDNDYVGWCLTPDGTMGVGKYGNEITTPTAQIESVDDIAADMFSLRTEKTVLVTDIVNVPVTGGSYNLLKVDKFGLIRFALTAAREINRIESAAKNKPFLVLRNGNSQLVTLKNDVNFLRLEGNKDLVLGYNDTVILLRAPGVPTTPPNAGVNIWIQVGGKRNSTDAVTTASLTATVANITGTATIATGNIATANISGTMTASAASITNMEVEAGFIQAASMLNVSMNEVTADQATIENAEINTASISGTASITNLSVSNQTLSTKSDLNNDSISGQNLDVGNSSFVEISLTTDQTVTTISSIEGHHIVWLRNVGPKKLTLVHDTSKIITTANRSLTLHPNDFVVIMRHSTAGGGAWTQVGGNVPVERTGLGQPGTMVIPATMVPSTTNVVLNNENMLFFPIRLDIDHPVSGLGVQVPDGMAVPTSKVHLSLFNHNYVTNKPDVLVKEGGQVDTHLDGIRHATFGAGYIPPYDGWYWICVQAQHNPRLRSSGTGQMLLGLVSLGASVKGLTTIGREYGDGIPASPAPETEPEGFNTPLCFALLDDD